MNSPVSASKKKQMKTSSSRSLFEYFQESDFENEAKQPGRCERKDRYKEKGDYFSDITGQVGHLKTKLTEPIKRCAEIYWGKHGLWNPEQKERVARLEKQLKARWALEELIEEQLNSFQEHYSRVMVPNKFKEIAELVMPKGTDAMELAALTWFGDWRPSSILNLLGSLYCFHSESNGVGEVLSQLVKEIRVEEAVIDEEMAEIQANCVFHLPFGRTKREGDSPMLLVQDEFRKIHAVITKAQNLRLKALELVAKKVLSQSDAAQFLISFSAVQDSIHQFIAHYRLEKDFNSQPISPAVPALGSFTAGGFMNLVTAPRTKLCEGKKYNRILQGKNS